MSSSARSPASRASSSAAANSLQGSGWALLVWDPLGKRLNINQLYDQQGNLPVGQLPILQLDMWEHAFYLQYKNVKADYVKAWWNVVNWTDVADSAGQGAGGGRPLSPQPDTRLPRGFPEKNLTYLSG